jgi:hypothetical protein
VREEGIRRVGWRPTRATQRARRRTMRGRRSSAVNHNAPEDSAREDHARGDDPSEYAAEDARDEEAVDEEDDAAREGARAAEEGVERADAPKPPPRPEGLPADRPWPPKWRKYPEDHPAQDLKACGTVERGLGEGRTSADAFFDELKESQEEEFKGDWWVLGLLLICAAQPVDDARENPSSIEGRFKWWNAMWFCEVRCVPNLTLRLEHASLCGAHLEHANFYRAQLERADLSGAHLEHARFFLADLAHANLQHARLGHASLMQCNLQYADLRFIHLEHASLVSTHLAHAQLFEAHLEHATLVGANLEYAHAFGASSGLLRTSAWPAWKQRSSRVPTLDSRRHPKCARLFSLRLQSRGPHTDFWRFARRVVGAAARVHGAPVLRESDPPRGILAPLRHSGLSPLRDERGAARAIGRRGARGAGARPRAVGGTDEGSDRGVPGGARASRRVVGARGRKCGVALHRVDRGGGCVQRSATDAHSAGIDAARRWKNVRRSRPRWRSTTASAIR